MRGMHERFQRKQLKWQQYASSYSKWAFGINFVILVMQIVQMLFHQLVEVFSNDANSTPVSYFPYFGISRYLETFCRILVENQTQLDPEIPQKKGPHRGE